MSTTTLTRPSTVTEAAPATPLTPAQENDLIALAASTERIQRTPGSIGSVRESRAWGLGGAVD